MTTMRINGFSGMDVDSMVKSLMTAEKAPLDKLNQQKTTLEWTQDYYKELNSKAFTFSNTKLKNYGLSSAMNSYKSSVTGNTDAIKVSATANANTMPMTISVKSLATQSTLTTRAAGYGLKTTSTLEEVQKKTGQPVEAANEYTLKINGQTFSFDKTLSIAEVMTKISGNTEAKATASFDELTGQFTIKSKEFGGAQKLNYKPEETEANTFIALFNNTKIEQKEIAVVEGKDAEVKINKQDLTFSSNNFTVNGIQITLLAPTTAQADFSDDKPSTINTTTDSTTALETIKSFVNDYNDLISTFSSKANEKRYRDYQPLTDEQKSAMNDNDVEMWEARAKSGLLRNDNILTSTVSSMRMVISENVGKLSAIGITTGQYYEGGKLYIDEDKLKAALESDPQSIQDLFQGPPSASDEGVFDKLRDVMNTTMTNFADKAGTSKYNGSLSAELDTESTIGKQLKRYEQQIDDLEDRLDDIEERYYKQFSAMETAMNKYQSQSSSLLSSLGMSSS